MKRAVILSCLLVATMSSVSGAQYAGPTFDDRPKITVTGEAAVNVTPDKIVIRFGIATHDMDIMVAKQKNNDILKKAVAAMKECGVPAKSIQTDHLSIHPRWQDDGQTHFLGYFVQNGVAVTLSDVAEVENLVTKVLQAGVNYIQGIDFQTTKLKQYREQARELALMAAKEKAVKMAGVLGQSVGTPLQISEYGAFGGFSSSYWSSWSGWGWGQSSGMSQNQVNQGGSSEIMDTVALGKIAIRASVNVTFELKK